MASGSGSDVFGFEVDARKLEHHDANALKLSSRDSFTNP